MQTYPLLNDAGELRAFEVAVPLLGRQWLVRRVARVPGVAITRRPEIFSWCREEIFCEFRIGDVSFEIWEPYGDNSRYWIGPLDNQTHSETRVLMEALR